jgi:putative Mg2+ transporter-C (MgtC) family protein
MDLQLFAGLDYQTTILLKLLLASFLGALVGLEREVHGRPAGFRTHLLVTVGACLMTLVSEHYFIKYSGHDSASALRIDPGRVAAQIVTGIGFLGAGVILKDGQTVRGLTTAACLWVAAGTGMAIGVGFYIPAIAVTLLSLLSLVFLKRFEGLFRKDRYRTLIIDTAEDTLSRRELIDILDEHGLRLVDFAMDRDCVNGEVRFDLVVVQPEGVPGVKLANIIAEMDRVKRVRFR